MEQRKANTSLLDKIDEMYKSRGLAHNPLNMKTPDFTFLGVKSGVCFAKH